MSEETKEAEQKIVASMPLPTDPAPATKSVPDVKLSADDAWKLLTAHTHGDELQHHARQVGAVMRAFGEHFGEDPEVWEVAGMLHDLDYEEHESEDEHCKFSEKYMREAGVDELYINAMKAHAPDLTGYTPNTMLERTLFTVDQLSGLINAVCLVRPSHSVMDVKLKSVKKKFKTGNFASGVNREWILKGCDMMGMSLEDVINISIAGLKADAECCGLKGDIDTDA